MAEANAPVDLPRPGTRRAAGEVRIRAPSPEHDRVGQNAAWDADQSRRRLKKRWNLRFGVVGVLPTLTLVTFVSLLLASGAPSRAPAGGRALIHLEKLGLAEIGLLGLAALVLSLILEPFQPFLLRLLEGYWASTRPGRALAELAAGRQRRRVQHLERAAYGGSAAEEEDWRRRLAASRLRAYPAEERLLPTKLGNALRAAEDAAGQRYGLDTITMWPRLWPYLPDHTRTVIAGLRDQLDIAVRLCLVLTLAAVIAVPLLFVHRTWLLVPAGTAVLAWLAYEAAVRAAIAFGNSLYVAFDLHRFDMLRGLHCVLPDPDQEVAHNKRLSNFFASRLNRSSVARQDYEYDHSPGPCEAGCIPSGS